MGIGVSEQLNTSITERDGGLVLVEPEKLVHPALLTDIPATGASGGVSGPHPH